VLERWKSDFENLLNQNSDQVIVNNDNINENSYDATILNETITREKIAKAVEHAKLRKTCGIDEIPVEVLKKPTAIELLYIICKGCLELGKVPDQWTSGIINPIFKPGSDDKKDPLSYWGITLISVPSKIYCNVLNTRLLTRGLMNIKYFETEWFPRET
jgi:hypothetical protein